MVDFCPPVVSSSKTSLRHARLVALTFRRLTTGPPTLCFGHEVGVHVEWHDAQTRPRTLVALENYGRSNAFKNAVSHSVEDRDGAKTTRSKLAAYRRGRCINMTCRGRAGTRPSSKRITRQARMASSELSAAALALHSGVIDTEDSDAGVPEQKVYTDIARGTENFLDAYRVKIWTGHPAYEPSSSGSSGRVEEQGTYLARTAGFPELATSQRGASDALHTLSRDPATSRALRPRNLRQHEDTSTRRTLQTRRSRLRIRTVRLENAGDFELASNASGCKYESRVHYFGPWRTTLGLEILDARSRRSAGRIFGCIDSRRGIAAFEC
ncbi:hypothetical protein V8D89_008808, partial [Ganoderma adspersum]